MAAQKKVLDFIAKEKASPLHLCDAPSPSVDASSPSPDDERLSVFLRNVEGGYREKIEVLESSSKRNLEVAVVGETGDGKSYLLNTLLGQGPPYILPEGCTQACTKVCIRCIRTPQPDENSAHSNNPGSHFCLTIKFKEWEKVREEWERDLPLLQSLSDSDESELGQAQPNPRVFIGTRNPKDPQFAVTEKLKGAFPQLFKPPHAIDGFLPSVEYALQQIQLTLDRQPFTGILGTIKQYTAAPGDTRSLRNLTEKVQNFCAPPEMRRGMIYPPELLRQARQSLVVEDAYCSGPFPGISEGTALKDVPGSGDDHGGRAAMYRGAVDSADVVLMVAAAHRAGSKRSHWNILGDRVARQLQMREGLQTVFAVTKVDQLTAPEEVFRELLGGDEKEGGRVSGFGRMSTDSLSLFAFPEVGEGEEGEAVTGGEGGAAGAAAAAAAERPMENPRDARKRAWLEAAESGDSEEATRRFAVRLRNEHFVQQITTQTGRKFGEQMASDLFVVPVSALCGRELRGLPGGNEGEDGDRVQRLRETGIPRLQDLLRCMIERKRLEGNREAIQRVAKHVEEAIEALQSHKRFSPNADGRTRERFETFARERIDAFVQSAETSAKSAVQGAWGATMDSAVEAATQSLAEENEKAWHEFGMERNGRLHMTYKATFARRGEWTTNWNVRLGDPFNEKISEAFQKFSSTSLDSALTQSVLRAVSGDFARLFTQPVASFLKEHAGVDAGDLISLQSRQTAQLCDRLASGMRARQNLRHEAVDDVYEKVKEELTPFYERAAADRGQGVHARRTEVMREPVKGAGSSRIENCKAPLLEHRDQVVRVIQTAVRLFASSLRSSLGPDYAEFFASSVAPEVILAEQAKARATLEQRAASLASLLESVNTRLERVNAELIDLRSLDSQQEPCEGEMPPSRPQAAAAVEQSCVGGIEGGEGGGGIEIESDSEEPDSSCSQQQKAKAVLGDASNRSSSALALPSSVGGGVREPETEGKPERGTVWSWFSQGLKLFGGGRDPLSMRKGESVGAGPEMDTGRDERENEHGRRRCLPSLSGDEGETDNGRGRRGREVRRVAYAALEGGPA
eukprot:Cvel_3697.t1-p1 / transcript=Cvel_3697.t1 / gene=Cvel_3697 / organism=Chromera_velia_CCMP2878 / gene_product=hypothetical protein / transcript_product=hypothetical protein / location=Cvel_scaffold154:1-4696(-) / protein_length=1080 / sequence_SO=supercontig / SO=protein_coding / is_pseudo=false